MKKFFIMFSLIVIIFSINSIQAQNYWSLELRPHVAFATQDLGDASLNTGIGFEGTIAFKFMPHLAAYAGWGWNQFSSDESFAGSNVDFEETGYTFGFQFIHPFPQSEIHYLVRLGGIYNHVEMENDKGDITADTKHGIGWQIGAGVVIPLNAEWKLLPTVRYRSLSRDVTIANIKTDLDLNYVSAGLGIAWSF